MASPLPRLMNGRNRGCPSCGLSQRPSSRAERVRAAVAPPAGKGKEPAWPRPRRRRRQARASGFMADARRAGTGPSPQSPVAQPQQHARLRSVVVHPPRATFEADEDGFHVVESRLSIPIALPPLPWHQPPRPHVQACALSMLGQRRGLGPHKVTPSAAKVSPACGRGPGGHRLCALRVHWEGDVGASGLWSVATRDTRATQRTIAATAPKPAARRPSMRPRTGIVIIPRSQEVNSAEAELSLALVAIVGRNRPMVSAADVRALLEGFYHLAPDEFSVSTYPPEDFLVRFRSAQARDGVLHAPHPQGTRFVLLWRPWRRQAWASAGSFRFCVLLGMRGIPSHLWNVAAAQQILGPACAGLEPAQATASQENMSEYTSSPLVRAPGPPIPGPYPIIQGHDWRTPPSTSDDEPVGDTDHSNDHGSFDGGDRGRPTRQPRRFGDGGGGGASASGGAANDEPRLGPGWGPTFWSAQSLIVGRFPCPVRGTAGGWSFGRKAKGSQSSTPAMTLVTDDAKPFPVVKEAPEADQLKFEFQVHQDRSSPLTWIDPLSITAEATRPLPQATPQSAGLRTSPSRAAEWVAMDHDAQD
ncbi:unnamed protein product [Miscanthus lutarioriparius]|uniref:DUF4283 domain-containing protein n=1 Tax=Miscanthus lutarioriparius TaxID=422564 RepID=A0A811S5A0_9POAL|nr:unnamed protein product [Miscanthus lutarioriparius]